MKLDGRRDHQLPRGIDLFPYARRKSIDGERIKIWQFGEDRNQRTLRELCETLLVPCSIELRPFVENANPGLVRPLGGVRLRGAARNGDRIPAYDAREVAQGRCENSEALAPVDVTRTPNHGLQLLPPPDTLEPAFAWLGEAAGAAQDQCEALKRVLQPQMCQELIAGEHGQTHPDDPAVAMDELGNAIDGALGGKPQGELIPSASNRFIWDKRHGQRWIGMRNAHRRALLLVLRNRTGDAKPGRCRKRGLRHSGGLACGRRLDSG